MWYYFPLQFQEIILLLTMIVVLKETTNKTTRCFRLISFAKQKRASCNNGEDIVDNHIMNHTYASKSINAPVIPRFPWISRPNIPHFTTYISPNISRLDQNHHFDNALQGRQDTQGALFALVNFHSPNHIADTRRSWALYLAWNGTCWFGNPRCPRYVSMKGLGERDWGSKICTI